METKVCKGCGRELPLDEFVMITTRGGEKVRNGYCKDCMTQKRLATRANNAKVKEAQLDQKVEDARKLRLSDFSPRELMEELARRGYKGKLTFVEVHTIDIQNF